MATESMLLSPQPKKPIFSPCRDVADEELFELLGCSEEGQHTPSLSTASTSGGTSPNKRDCLSPGLQFRNPAPESFPSSPEVPCGNQRKQSSKVFVGGIPQFMDQSSLREEFTHIGKVKKAWIQRSREGQNQPTNGEHRGFGFVVFEGDNTVDVLLGREESIFLSLSNGCQVEVKRAVSSSAMKQMAGKDAEGSDQAKTAYRATHPLHSITNHPLDEWGCMRGRRGIRCVAQQVQNMPDRTMTLTPTSQGNVPWPMGGLQAQALPCTSSQAVGPNGWIACTMATPMAFIGHTRTPELPKLPSYTNHTNMLAPEALFQQAKILHGDALESVLIQNVPDCYED